MYACLLACEYPHVCTHECIWSSMNIKHPAICPCRVQLIAGNVCLMQSRECHLILNSCDFCLTKEPFSIGDVNILVWCFIWAVVFPSLCTLNDNIKYLKYLLLWVELLHLITYGVSVMCLVFVFFFIFTLSPELKLYIC